jgi:hypothetical protein
MKHPAEIVSIDKALREHAEASAVTAARDYTQGSKEPDWLRQQNAVLAGVRAYDEALSARISQLLRPVRNPVAEREQAGVTSSPTDLIKIKRLLSSLAELEAACDAACYGRNEAESRWCVENNETQTLTRLDRARAHARSTLRTVGR